MNVSVQNGGTLRSSICYKSGNIDPVRLSMVIFLVGLLFFMAWGFWLFNFDSNTPLIFESSSVPVHLVGVSASSSSANSSFSSGDKIAIEQNVCNNTKNTKKQQIQVHWVDTVMYSQPVDEVFIDVGCGDFYMEYIVPSLPSGTYYLSIEIVTKVNFIRERKTKLVTHEFEIE